MGAQLVEEAIRAAVTTAGVTAHQVTGQRARSPHGVAFTLGRIFLDLENDERCSW
jgi:hypothetical protein